MDKSLLEYINNSLQQGLTRPSIEQALVQTGWKKEQIDEAFQQLSNQEQPTDKLKVTRESSDDLKETKKPKRWLQIVILAGSYILLTIFDIKYWALGGIGLLLCCDAESCPPTALGFGLILSVSWIILTAIPGILLVSILANWRNPPLLALIIGGLPLLFFEIVASVTSSQFKTASLVKLFLPKGFVYGPVLPNVLVIMALIFGITLLVYHRFKQSKIGEIFIKIELGLFLIFLLVQMIIPGLLLKASIQKSEPAEKLPTGVFYYETAHKDYEYDLYRLDSNGGRKKVNLPEKCRNIIPSWDKIKVYCNNFESALDTYTVEDEIFIVNGNTGEKKSLKMNDVGLQIPSGLWSWSRDGKYLLFASKEFDARKVKEQIGSNSFHNVGKTPSNRNVYLLDTDAMKVSILYSVGEGDNITSAFFSPDGKKVAIAAVIKRDDGKSNGSKNTLLVLDLDTKQTKIINSIDDCIQYRSPQNLHLNNFPLLCETIGVQWSSDSKHLFYYTKQEERIKKVITTFEEDVKAHDYKLVLANIDDLTKKVVDREYVETNNFFGEYFVEIFDGTDNFYYMIKGDFEKLNLTSGETTKLKKLTSSIRDDSQFTFDGKWVIYRIPGAGSWRVWVEETEGDKKLQILNNNEFHLGWDLRKNPKIGYWIY